MHVLLATIPHSGTSKTIRMFEKAGFTQMGVDEPSNAHPDENKLRWCHLHAGDRRDRVYEMASWGYPLICAIRHPWRNLASHKHRSVSQSTLDMTLEAWEDCLERIFPRALLLPVDADELTRARYKRAIERELEIELNADWKRLVNTRHPTTAFAKLEEVVPADQRWQWLDDHWLIQEVYHADLAHNRVDHRGSAGHRSEQRQAVQSDRDAEAARD